MNLIRKIAGTVLCSSLLKMCVQSLKLIVCCTGAHQVFTTTEKPFPSEIPLKMKTATSNSLIKLRSVKFLLNSLTSNKSILEQKSKYLNSIRVFPFFHFSEIFSKRTRKMENYKADITFLSK